MTLIPTFQSAFDIKVPFAKITETASPHGHKKTASHAIASKAGCPSYNNFSIASDMADGLVVGS